MASWNPIANFQIFAHPLSPSPEQLLFENEYLIPRCCQRAFLRMNAFSSRKLRCNLLSLLLPSDGMMLAESTLCGRVSNGRLTEYRSIEGFLYECTSRFPRLPSS